MIYHQLPDGRILPLALDAPAGVAGPPQNPVQSNLPGANFGLQMQTTPAPAQTPIIPPGAQIITEEQARSRVNPAELVSPEQTQAPAPQQTAPGPEAGISEATQAYLESRMKPRYSAPTPDREMLSSRKVEMEQRPPATPEMQKAVDEYADLESARARYASEALKYNALRMEENRLVDEGNLIRQQQDLDEAKARRQKIDAQLGTLQKNLTNAQTAAANAKAPTSENYWKEKGPLAQVFSALSVAIGAYSQGLRGGGENIGLTLMNQGIDRYIADQKAKADMLKDKATDANNDYVRFLNMYGDPETAEHALRLEKMGLVEAMSKNRAQKIGTQQAMADAEMFLTDWRQQQIIAQQKAYESGAAKITEEYKTIPGKAGGYTQIDPLRAVEGAAKFREAMNKIYGIKEGKVNERVAEQQLGRKVRLNNGQQVWAKDSKAADKSQAVIDVMPAFQQNIARQKELARMALHSGDPSIRAELQAITQRNKLLMKQLEDLGAITSSDQELVSPLVGEGAEKFFKLDAATESTLDAASQHIKQRLDQVQRNLYQDPEITKPILGTGASSFKPVE